MEQGIAIRVLHVLWTLGVGGAERAVYQLIREQRRNGTEAEVAVGEALGRYGELLRADGVAAHELGCRGAWDVARSLRLRGLARRFDIVHLHSIEPLLAAAAFGSGSRIVYTHRGGVRKHGAIKRLRTSAARPLIRRADRLSANTNHSRLVVANWLGVPAERVAVVYNGLDFSLLSPTRPRSDVAAELNLTDAGMVVGTASNLQPLKRVELLLEAVAESARQTDVHCLVLGDGPSRPSLERLAETLGISRRVVFAGRKDDVRDYLQVMDSFVLPSGPEEAFGNALVEAMGVGLPVIAFADGGGLVEHIEDGRSGIIVRDVSELSAALIDLAADMHLRERLGRAAMLAVQSRYSLASMCEGYAQLYAGARSA